MTIVLRSTYIRSLHETGAPYLRRMRLSAMDPIVSDIFRFRSIGSLQALSLAIAAAIVTPVLLWLVL